MGRYLETLSVNKYMSFNVSMFAVAAFVQGGHFGFCAMWLLFVYGGSYVSKVLHSKINITFASAIRFAKALQLTSFRSSETAMVQKMV